MRERERKRGKKKERKRERKREKRRENYVQGQILSIFNQFSKRKTEYIGKNAQNFKNRLPADLYIQQMTVTIRAPVGANKVQAIKHI